MHVINLLYQYAPSVSTTLGSHQLSISAAYYSNMHLVSQRLGISTSTTWYLNDLGSHQFSISTAYYSNKSTVPRDILWYAGIYTAYTRWYAGIHTAYTRWYAGIVSLGSYSLCLHSKTSSVVIHVVFK